MRLTKEQQRVYTRQMKDRFERYIDGYYYTWHKYPSMREIQKGLDIPSLSTVSRYVHKLLDEGKIKLPAKAEQSNLLTEQNVFLFNNPPRRKCIRTIDGSVFFIDCQVVKNDKGKLDVQVSGVIDLSLCKRCVTQVVSCKDVEG